MKRSLLVPVAVVLTASGVCGPVNADVSAAQGVISASPSRGPRKFVQTFATVYPASYASDPDPADNEASARTAITAP